MTLAVAESLAKEPERAPTFGDEEQVTISH